MDGTCCNVSVKDNDSTITSAVSFLTSNYFRMNPLFLQTMG